MIRSACLSAAVLIVSSCLASADEPGEVRHVYPAGYQGEKVQPAFEALSDAIRGSASAWTAPDPIRPGGTIVIHGGTLRADRYSYRDTHHLLYFGTYFPAKFSPHLAWRGGKQQAPLTIRAAGDGETILDGFGANVLLDLSGVGPVVLEGLTLTNCDVAILAAERGAIPCARVTLRDCTFRNVQVGLWANHPSARGYTIENCTFVGIPGRRCNGVTLAGNGHTLSGNTFREIDDEVRRIDDCAPPVEIPAYDPFAKMARRRPDADQPTTTPDELTVDPPTLHNLGFYWPIHGDVDRDAKVTVRYRPASGAEWREALDLMRADLKAMRISERHAGLGAQVDDLADYFAGSICNLQPGTSYECRLTLTDPDGVQGAPVRTVTVATRAEPANLPARRTIHVYPPDYRGGRAEQAAAALDAAFAGPGRAGPGDHVVLHAGTYTADPASYVDAGGHLSIGGWQIRAEGTAEAPVVIRPAGDGEVILDGAGGQHVLDVRYSKHLRIEGLTLRRAEIGILAAPKDRVNQQLEPTEGLVVRRCRVADVFIGLWGLSPQNRDFMILDNTFVAREWKRGEYKSKWDHLYSEAGIDLCGTGHVVGHNRIEGFWDGINAYDRSVGVDYFHNIVADQKDNSFGSGSNGDLRNVRVYRNYWGGGGPTLHIHTLGGPIYMFRNHVNGSGFLKLQFARTNGVLYYHNTHYWPFGGHGGFGKLDVRNNIWVSRGGWQARTWSDETTIDCNGWLHVPGRSTYSWSTPSGKGKASSLAALGEAVGWCRRAVTVTDWAEVFAERRGPALQADSPMVDAGCRLPTINDEFTGAGPDIGLHEFGQPLPTYGPRPKTP